MTLEEHVNVLERYCKGDNIIHNYKTLKALFPKLKVIKCLISRSAAKGKGYPGVWGFNILGPIF